MDTNRRQETIAADDYSLAVQARTGDPEALTQLAERTRPALFAVCYAELRHYEDAQDAVANALLRICRRISTLKDPTHVRPWMLRIARNEARRLRAPSSITVQFPQKEEATSEETATIHIPAVSLLRLDVERALRHQPRDSARAAALFLLDGLPITEIAIRLGRPEGTIKYWLSRSRSALQPQLEGYCPMETLSSSPRSNVAVLSSEIAPALLGQISDALKAAGWHTVRHVRTFTGLGRLESAGEAPATLRIPEPIPDCGCVVLDETLGGHSAFEVATLIRSQEWGKNATLFLLADRKEDATEAHLSTVAAYIAGFDMMLTKPFDLSEFERFAHRLRSISGSPSTSTV